MDIYTILSSKPHNAYYLEKYIFFIKRNYKKYDDGENVEKHHILPKAEDMFPEYINFGLHEWNCILLPLKKHFYAHYLLSKAFYFSNSQIYAFCLMGGRLKNKNILFLAKEYEKGVKKRNEINCLLMQNTVTALDINTGRCSRVTKDTFDNNDNLIGITKGKFSGHKNVSKRKEVKEKISAKKKGLVNVFDREKSKIIQINKDDFDANRYEIKTGFSGRTNYVIKTRSGEVKSITFDDPLFETNEYVSNNTRYILKIKMNDEEFHINNEYTKNKFRDETQTTIRPTNRLPDEYKMHTSGKFMLKKEPVKLFFNEYP